MNDLLTAGGLILTVLLAYMQIQRTQAATVRAQEAHLRNELKVNIYDRVAGVFDQASQAMLAMSSHYRSTFAVLDLKIKGLPLGQLRSSFELLASNQAANTAVIAVLKSLEQYEIAFHRFRTIRREWSIAHRQLMDTHSALWPKLVGLLPAAASSATQPATSLVQPTKPLVDEALSLYKPFENACSDLVSYLIDIQIESQNELLGELFAHQLPPRHPLDKTLKVLTRDKDDIAVRPPGGLV